MGNGTYKNEWAAFIIIVTSTLGMQGEPVQISGEMQTVEMPFDRDSTSFEGFRPPANPLFNLTTAELIDEERTILNFGQKVLGNSRDLEPEIGAIIQKRFWDMV